VSSSLEVVAFRFQLSDLTLFTLRRRMVTRGFAIDEVWNETLALPGVSADCQGMMLRSLPSPDASPGVSTLGSGSTRALCYVMQRYPRYFIDMSTGFEDYKKKFSSKTRATLGRKVRKFTDHCGGLLRWERFSRAEDLDRFWRGARQVSAQTYQERLLDAGLPDSLDFIAAAKKLAANDSLRAFLLFDGDRPVSYLYCPIDRGIVEYAFLGYDPAYMRHSVGTVLQWLALESLFAERRFRYFDFTEGDSDHKRLFATDHRICVNLALFRPSARNWLLAYSHHRFSRATEALGRWLDRHDLKTKARRFLRFGRVTA